MTTQPAAQTPVLVVGEALIDVVARGEDRTEHVGGSPANVAIGVGRLGHPTALVTLTGTDARGERIRETVEASGVFLAPGSDRAERTSTATATIGDDGAATYVFDLTWELPAEIPMPQGGHVHTGSIAATLEPGSNRVRRLIEDARSAATISYDPNARPSLMGSPAEALAWIGPLVGLADVVKASDEDCAWLYPGASLADITRDWAASGAVLTVVTRGGEGVYVRKGTEEAELQAQKVQVADTVGAGDSFMSGLISGLLDAGYLGGPDARERLASATLDDVLPAIRRALACASITVTRAGANPPWRDELGQ